MLLHQLLIYIHHILLLTEKILVDYVSYIHLFWTLDSILCSISIIIIIIIITIDITIYVSGITDLDSRFLISKRLSVVFSGVLETLVELIT